MTRSTSTTEQDSVAGYITLGTEMDDAGSVLRVLGRWEDPAEGTVDPVKAADLVSRGMASFGAEPSGKAGSRSTRATAASLQPDTTGLPTDEEPGNV